MNNKKDEDLLDSMTMKIDQLIFTNLLENEIIKVANIIDEYGVFKIEQHDEIDGKLHLDPKIVIRIEDPYIFETLKNAGIPCAKGLSILYLESSRLLLSRTAKYLTKNKSQAKFIMESINLKDIIRESHDESVRMDAYIKLRKIMKVLESEGK